MKGYLTQGYLTFHGLSITDHPGLSRARWPLSDAWMRPRAGVLASGGVQALSSRARPLAVTTARPQSPRLLPAEAPPLICARSDTATQLLFGGPTRVPPPSYCTRAFIGQCLITVDAANPVSVHEKPCKLPRLMGIRTHKRASAY